MPKSINVKNLLLLLVKHWVSVSECKRTQFGGHAALLINMRTSLRLLAKVKPGTFLEANTPTGLTGLTTHPAPRPALILTYRQTLEKLQQLPATSVYRQSTEALTKHRLSIVESTKPAGYEEWLSRVQEQISANPDAYKGMKRPDGSYGYGRVPEETSDVWDGVVNRSSALDTGNFTKQAVSDRGRRIEEEVEIAEKPELPTVDDLEPEPPLDAAQYVHHFWFVTVITLLILHAE